ncbi:hypothetical protein OKW32_001708 [Paraburkholderia youngii]
MCAFGRTLFDPLAAIRGIAKAAAVPKVQRPFAPSGSAAACRTKPTFGQGHIHSATNGGFMESRILSTGKACPTPARICRRKLTEQQTRTGVRTTLTPTEVRHRRGSAIFRPPARMSDCPFENQGQTTSARQTSLAAWTPEAARICADLHEVVGASLDQRNTESTLSSVDIDDYGIDDTNIAFLGFSAGKDSGVSTCCAERLWNDTRLRRILSETQRCCTDPLGEEGCHVLLRRKSANRGDLTKRRVSCAQHLGGSADALFQYESIQ